MNMKIRTVTARVEYETDDVIELKPRNFKTPGKIRTYMGWVFLSLAMSVFFRIKGWGISVNGSRSESFDVPSDVDRCSKM